ncbi:MAG: ABC transporter ATP-binding protein [Candidatus Bathyarchaeota archaeon]|nr:ABC transporter ATP-binding protein [Candidatus Bathyarchaeota archaeon]
MLVVEGLSVSVEEKEILHGVDLEVKEGEIHALFGPNGAGKTSLLMAIMGIPPYRVTEGRILFKGEDITDLLINERARLGIGLSFQRPPTIRGLRTRKMVEICSGGKANAEEMASYLKLEDFLDRDVNYGFSGGEIKRAELLQLLAQNPDLILIDEPESGVDLESIALIGEAINRLLRRDVRLSERRKMPLKTGLIITHTGHILDYVKVDKAHVMCHGRIGCSGHPLELLEEIRKMGYEECIRCHLQGS